MYINLKMFKRLFNLTASIIISLLILCTSLNAKNINNIEIKGNERIPDETILMFSQIKIGDILNDDSLNNILKKLYETNFFEDVSVFLNKNQLTIIVKENPIIENIFYNGIKSNTLREELTSDLELKLRSSYNEVTLKKDKLKIISILKDLGYYFSDVDIEISYLEDNKIDLIYNITLGEKQLKKLYLLETKFIKKVNSRFNSKWGI